MNLPGKVFLGLMILFSVHFVFAAGEGIDELPLLGRGGGASGDFGMLSLFGNPAGFSRSPQFGAIAMYENLWGISEYGTYCVGGGANTKYAALGAYFNFFGSADIYSELSAGLVVARSFGNIVDVGVRARFLSISFPEPYGNTSTMFFDFGLQHNFRNIAAVGFYWQNPGQASKIVGYDANELISFGFRYDATSWVSVFADVQFTQSGPGELYLGQNLKITRWLSISGGAGGRPTKFYLAANFNWNDFSLAWTGAIHPELGITNGGKIMWRKR
ncbi:hypothetical protein DRQ26_03535 [bacterium]|nr:MAG: hypothetical protein DRQ26_03535 [bacterium]